LNSLVISLPNEQLLSTSSGNDLENWALPNRTPFPDKEVPASGESGSQQWLNACNFEWQETLLSANFLQKDILHDHR
jgi:hypothetical protein